MSNPPFSIFYNEDGYTTDRKIMGRQISGKSFLHGVAAFWRNGNIHAICQNENSVNRLCIQLQEVGFSGPLSCTLLPNWNSAKEAGSLYYPAPPTLEVASSRERVGPTAFSIMGITHTLSSQGVLNLIASMALPPFRPWDALICTSRAAHTLVTRLHDETREYWRRTTGASRFNEPVLPVIPLGIDAPALAASQTGRTAARANLRVDKDETVFLFAGRLAVHAKCNPGPVYITLERLAATHRITCIEAGIYANPGMRAAIEEAQKRLAPSVRFIWANGAAEQEYDQAWQAADIFMSLSDNIQETFGLTPVEAMARGLPVIVSDWDGYKDTVRDGVDGFRVPTITPPTGAGNHLIASYLAADSTYDRYIGNVSMTTVVDVGGLHAMLERLVTNPDLRHTMGASGRQRAHEVYDWSAVLPHYVALTDQLREVREKAARDGNVSPFIPPQHADPFHLFGHFATSQLSGDWIVTRQEDSADRLPKLLDIFVSNYGFEERLVKAEFASRLLDAIPTNGIQVSRLLSDNNLSTQFGVRALMWLWKFDLIKVLPT